MPKNHTRISRVRGTLGGAVLTTLLAATASAQTGQPDMLSGLNPANAKRGGFHLYDVTGFTGWESQANPYGNSLAFTPGANTLGADETYGGSASMGWTMTGQRSNVSIAYTASYLGRVQYSEWNSLSHFLTIGANRRLTPKWNLSFAGSSSLSTYDQSLFSPMVFGASTPFTGSFDDLASAVLSGKYTNDQLASLLTGSPVIDSPSRTYFFGNRVWTSSLNTSATYAHSQKLSFNFSSGFSQTQHIEDSAPQGSTQYPYLIPRASYGSASAGMSYALTPRTQVGLSMNTSRGFSALQEAYTTYGTGYIGRTIGRRWFAQIHGGAGFVTALNAQYPGGDRTSPVYGASLGYKMRAHGFIGAYDRIVGQAYGAGAADMTTISAGWNWRRPGSTWGLSSNYGRQQYRNGLFGDVDGWRATFGVNRRVSRNAMIEAGYAYASYTGIAGTTPYDSEQHAVRLTVIWIPSGMEAR